MQQSGSPALPRAFEVDALEPISPIGTPADVAGRRRAARSALYREQSQARAGSREVAWLLIRYRMDHGLSQQELADRAGSSLALVKRIESGRNAINVEALRRIAHALGLKLVLGFEHPPTGDRTERDLIAI
jgi:ribosome-binding protein aMBF1 (putative translation factor)